MMIITVPKHLIMCGLFINVLHATTPKCSIKFDITICYSNTSQGIVGNECRDDVSTCRKGFSITHIRVEPYSTEIVEDLVAHEVPAASVNTIGEAVQDPVLRDRDMLVDIEHPEK